MPTLSRVASSGARRGIPLIDRARSVSSNRPIWDFAAVVLLLVVALPLRFVELGALPFGFHGDEAAMGIEAGRILHRGWIGVYSGEAGGTPAGPYYAAAAAIHFWGGTIFAARFASACFDTATVLMVWTLCRRNISRAAALTSGLLSATSTWQLSFARLAFINSAWPSCVVAGTIALCEARRSGSRFWWLACGGLMASGLYAYPGHLLFLGVLALFLIVLFARSPRTWTTVSQIGAFTLGFGVAAWPMVRFARKHPDTYFRTGRGVSVFNSAGWAATQGLLDRALFLVRRYVEVWSRLILHPFPDGIDGTGAAPMVPPVLAIACVVGILFAWRRRSTLVVLYGATVIALMPWAVATSNQYPLRRALIVSPFISLFAGLGIADAARLAVRRAPRFLAGALLIAAAATLLIGWKCADNYFERSATSSQIYWTLAGDLVNSVALMQQLPPDAYVYFYAQRWPFASAEQTFLAPGVMGESRGAEFGENGYAIDPRRGRPVVILVGRYQALLPALQIVYPNSSFNLGPADPSAQPSYVVFYPGASIPVQ